MLLDRDERFHNDVIVIRQYFLFFTGKKIGAKRNILRR